MTRLANAPASVQGWFAAEKSADPSAGLRAVLAHDAVFDFGGRKANGIDAVVATLGLMMPPGWLGEVEWNLLPATVDAEVTVRGTGPGGALLPSPGGPMDYIEFTFTLATNGLISRIVPQPHQPEPPDLLPALKPGDRAPNFVLPDVHGGDFPLLQSGARATVVGFVCNHCPFSLRWHDRLQQVARDYDSRGVRLLQINPDDPAIHSEDGIDYSRIRVAAGEFAGPYLVDESQRVARRWGVRYTSEMFVIDADGIVAYHGAPDADVGDASLNAAWVRAALDRVLAGAPAEPAQTKPVGCAVKWTW